MRLWSGVKAALLASGALGSLVGISGVALAGGFSVREQSTEFQGMSFAGNATSGGGLSGMFWNPAVAAYAPVGIYTESHYAGIIGRVNMTGDLFSGAVNLGLPRESGDIARDAIVPSSYLSYRINERLVFALSVNSPFGLVTEPQHSVWAGQFHARTSDIKTYNFSPTLAYRVTPTLAVGVGLQIQHIEGRLKRAASPNPTSDNLVIHGDDTAFGFTAGVNWTPTAGTHIGLGYRSSIDHTLEGTVGLARANPLTAQIKAGTTLPEIVTLSLRQAVSPTWTVLGTVEWTNWSRAQKLDVVCTQNPSTLCPGGTGSVISSLPLSWHDGWFFSLGAEHRYSEKLTLRAGVAYEISPIQEATERSLRVPDTDRLWLSAGATYKWNDKLAFDLAYTHIFGVGDNSIERIETLRFIGHVDAQVDIISASMKYRFGGEEHHHHMK
jgi:long-chain fatty acid transport protein